MSTQELQAAASELLKQALELAEDPRDAIALLGRAQALLMAITRKDEIPLEEYLDAVCGVWREDLRMVIEAVERSRRERESGDDSSPR